MSLNFYLFSQSILAIPSQNSWINFSICKLRLVETVNFHKTCAKQSLKPNRYPSFNISFNILTQRRPVILSDNQLSSFVNLVMACKNIVVMSIDQLRSNNLKDIREDQILEHSFNIFPALKKLCSLQFLCFKNSFLFGIPLRIFKWGVCSFIILALSIINTKLVTKKLLIPTELSEAQVFCIYETAKVFLVCENKHFIFATF